MSEIRDKLEAYLDELEKNYKKELKTNIEILSERVFELSKTKDTKLLTQYMQKLEEEHLRHNDLDKKVPGFHYSFKDIRESIIDRITHLEEQADIVKSQRLKYKIGSFTDE